jgi:PASTA domain
MRRAGLILVVIGLMASGCFGSGSASPASTAGHPTVRAPRDRVAVTVKLGLKTRLPITYRYSLTCDPAGGTMPRPNAACHAIANELHQPGATVGCIGADAPATATAGLIGTFAHKHFRLTIDTGSWCGEPKQVMRDYWTLSTFPCSTIVLHTTNVSSYADWARASGCSAAVEYVPKVTPMYVQDAERAVQAVGLRGEIASAPAITDADRNVNGYAIQGQSPAAGTRVHSGMVVVLRLAVSVNLGFGGVGKPGDVPQLVGMPINQAIEAATSVGLHVTVPAVHHPIASDSVTGQSISAGSRVTPASIITLTLG